MKPESTWVEVLDDLERRIVDAEAALDNDEAPVVEPFEPPADIEPLPIDLRDRAVEILRRHSEIEARIENIKRAIAGEIGNTTRASRATSAFSDTPKPSFHDSKS